MDIQAVTAFTFIRLLRHNHDFNRPSFAVVDRVDADGVAYPGILAANKDIGRVDALQIHADSLVVSPWADYFYWFDDKVGVNIITIIYMAAIIILPISRCSVKLKTDSLA